MRVIGVIPARYNSSRFKGKPLVDISGKSMIRRVFEQASKSKLLSRVVVATDDERIFNHLKEINADVVMTSSNHLNGTERIAEALDKITDSQYDVVVNIQGDEPFIEPEQIDEAVRVLIDHPDAEIGTLKYKAKKGEADNANRVKVVTDLKGKALYFSRSVIPFDRDSAKDIQYYFHVGLYSFRVPVLKKIVCLKPTPLETTEKLEQLRWLENGFSIYVSETKYESCSIDVPEDVDVCLKLNRNKLLPQ